MSQPRPWGPGWTQSSGTTGTDPLLAHRYPPSTGKVRSWSPAGSPPCCHLLPAPLNGAVPHKQEMLSGCSAPTPWVLTAPPPPFPDPGTQRASHGRRPRCEGQTGEAGPGTASPLVNSAGPCSLFKALNRGWYLSSPEFGAGGGAGTGFTPSNRAGAVGGTHASPDGSMWGVSLAATCPSSPSRPPFTW